MTGRPSYVYGLIDSAVTQRECFSFVSGNKSGLTFDMPWIHTTGLESVTGGEYFSVQD